MIWSRCETMHKMIKRTQNATMHKMIKRTQNATIQVKKQVRNFV